MKFGKLTVCTLSAMLLAAACAPKSRFVPRIATGGGETPVIATANNNGILNINNVDEKTQGKLKELSAFVADYDVSLSTSGDYVQVQLLVKNADPKDKRLSKLSFAGLIEDASKPTNLELDNNALREEGLAAELTMVTPNEKSDEIRYQIIVHYANAKKVEGVEGPLADQKAGIMISVSVKNTEVKPQVDLNEIEEDVASSDVKVLESIKSVRSVITKSSIESIPEKRTLSVLSSKETLFVKKSVVVNGSEDLDPAFAQSSNDTVVKSITVNEQGFAVTLKGKEGKGLNAKLVPVVVKEEPKEDIQK